MPWNPPGIYPHPGNRISCLRQYRDAPEESVKLCLNKNAVIYFEVNASRISSDRGYDYDRVISGY